MPHQHFSTHTHTHFADEHQDFEGALKGGIKAVARLFCGTTHTSTWHTKFLVEEVLGGVGRWRPAQHNCTHTQIQQPRRHYTPGSWRREYQEVGGRWKPVCSPSSSSAAAWGPQKYSNTVSAMHTQYLLAHVRLNICSPSSSAYIRLIPGSGSHSTVACSGQCCCVQHWVWQCCCVTNVFDTTVAFSAGFGSVVANQCFWYRCCVQCWVWHEHPCCCKISWKTST